MFDLNLEKVGHGINFIQFKVGEFFFPILEPFFRLLENKNPEIRRHIGQAETNLENNSLDGALLNLNMVLSLRPNHFLARVYRGRIYIHKRRYHLATEDYIQANQISRYRFIHYDLYREYFSSLNKGVGHFSTPIIQNFNQAFDIMQQGKENLPNESEINLGSELEAQIPSEPMDETEENVLENDPTFSKEEWSKFRNLNPITQKEIQKTDWEKLIKDLSSKTKDK